MKVSVIARGYSPRSESLDSGISLVHYLLTSQRSFNLVTLPGGDRRARQAGIVSPRRAAVNSRRER